MKSLEVYVLPGLEDQKTNSEASRQGVARPRQEALLFG
jgi:hypothetical protein